MADKPKTRRTKSDEQRIREKVQRYIYNGKRRILQKYPNAVFDEVEIRRLKDYLIKLLHNRPLICYYNEAHILTELPKITLDHIEPIDGPETHVVENVVPCCLNCNIVKARKQMNRFDKDIRGGWHSYMRHYNFTGYNDDKDKNAGTFDRRSITNGQLNTDFSGTWRRINNNTFELQCQSTIKDPRKYATDGQQYNILKVHIDEEDRIIFNDCLREGMYRRMRKRD